jgi:hypothetical protein
MQRKFNLKALISYKKLQQIRVETPVLTYEEPPLQSENGMQL